jgi:glutathione S-transferase
MGIPFSEVRFPLFDEDSKEELLKYSPSGKVPALLDDDVTVWDSLAICEYVSEHYPGKQCWPKSRSTRAAARSISYEMHSSFFSIRNTLPMNCRKRLVFKDISASLQSDINRVCNIWHQCRQLHAIDGPFLFGKFSIADAMYAPVVLRFQSYGIEVGETEKEYMHSIISLSSLTEWVEAGIVEKEYLPKFEVDA